LINNFILAGNMVISYFVLFAREKRDFTDNFKIFHKILLSGYGIFDLK